MVDAMQQEVKGEKERVIGQVVVEVKDEAVE